MKNVFSAVLTMMILASASLATGGDCGNSLLFHKGTELHASTYDGQGKETGRQVSSVVKVYQEGGMSVAELNAKNTDPAGANEKTSRVLYKCDGKKLYIDLAGLMGAGQNGAKMETSAIEFPFEVSVGETLPDASFSVTITTSGGRTRTMTSHIKERKVEAKEAITTPAGTFKCYRVSALVEADMGADMDEKRRKAMEQMRQKMGKNRMIYWYAPDVTVIKSEYYMGDKLMTRTEITGIKK